MSTCKICGKAPVEKEGDICETCQNEMEQEKQS